MEEYIELFKKYPQQFPPGYFKFLKKSLQKHLDDNTLIFKHNVLLTWKVYKRNTKRYKKGDVKIAQIINKYPGSGEATLLMNEFILKYPHLKLEVRNDNPRAIRFYKKLGFFKVQDIFFGKKFPGMVMEFGINQ